MNKFKRSICFLVALLTVMSSMVACASKSEEVTETQAETEADTFVYNEEEDSLDARSKVSDNLPDYNAEGADFSILTPDGMGEYDYIASLEEQTGDVVEDAAFERNAKVSDRFNVNINVVENGDHTACGETIKSLVLSGDDCYDLLSGQAVTSGGNAQANIFYNWRDVDYIDFDKPWWNSNSADALTINDVLLLMPSYMTMSVVSKTYCMYLNKNLAEAYNISDYYDTVNNGEWTLEKLESIITGVYKDLNGNGEEDDEDQYGFATSALSPAVTFTWAFNLPIVSFDEDYNAKIELATQHAYDCFTDLFDLYYNTEGVTSTVSDYFYTRSMFMTGNMLLASGEIGWAANNFRELDTDYAILPYPKYDEHQEEYYTMVDGGHSILGIPLTVNDLKKCGIIIEALTAETWKSVLPQYYDVALKVKGVRDTESVEVLDNIVDSVVVDFAYIFDNWSGLAFTFQDLLKSQNNNLSSYLASKEQSAIKYYENVVQLFVD